MWKLPEGYGTIMDPTPIAKIQLAMVAVIISAVLQFPMFRQIGNYDDYFMALDVHPSLMTLVEAQARALELKEKSENVAIRLWNGTHELMHAENPLLFAADHPGVVWEAAAGATITGSSTIGMRPFDSEVEYYPLHIAVGDRVAVLWGGIKPAVYVGTVIKVCDIYTVDVLFDDDGLVEEQLETSRLRLVDSTAGFKEETVGDVLQEAGVLQGFMIVVGCIVLTWLLTYANIRAKHAHFIIPEGTTRIISGGSQDSWKKWGVDKKKVTKVTIPRSVTSIGKWAFSGCSSLVSVVIPSTVTRIEQSAFDGCGSLASVKIPSAVTSIGERAFSGCSLLAQVEIPSTVNNISAYAFYKCSSLVAFGIPPAVTNIAKGTFWGCSSLKSVSVPSTVTSIGERAFSGCDLLTGLVIPPATTFIGAQAFHGCCSLKHVELPSVLTRINAYSFSGCSSLMRVEIPPSVTSIIEYAFSGCNAMTSVGIPASVTSIGENAFWGCTSLRVLLVQPINDADPDDSVVASDTPAAAVSALQTTRGNPTTTAATAATAKPAIIQAFNEDVQFPAVTKIWATDDIITELKGPFEAYGQFSNMPQPLRVAPKAETWAAVQLWLWWLPPADFYVAGDSRTVCKSRQATLWTVMLSVSRASETPETMPELEPELWEQIFGFLKHNQQPDF